MSDRGRYDYDITTGNRSYGDSDRGRERERGSGGGFSRNSGSMFGMGGSREHSSGGDDGQRGGSWTQERENFGWGRDRDRDRGDDRHEPRSRGGMSGDQGKRMSSGWGGLAGEQMGRDRSHERSRERSHEHRGEHMGRGRDHQRSDHGREREFGRDDRQGGLPIDETSRLIASNKVEGTAVYGSDGHRLGSIYNFMVDKRSGKVEYAVMRYGGMLGMGGRYYPLPWDILTYDTDEGGYRIRMTERDLEDAPSFDRDTEPQFNRSYGEHVNSWYGLGRK
jgi:hypothetical protein